MLVLIHPDGKPQTKSFSSDGDKFDTTDVEFSRLYGWEWAQVDGLDSLSKTLRHLESQNDRMIIRGQPVASVQERQLINRKMIGVEANIRSNPCQWLCIDIDKLELPENLNDFNRSRKEIAQHAALMLPCEFQDVDFHFQFSSSMGIKSGIRIHLWFWLDQPVTDSEAKGWLQTADVPVDLSLYSPIQPHFTAAPIFDPPSADPVQMRSGLFEYGNGVTAVSVPDDLEERFAEQEKNRSKTARHIGGGNALDHQDIIRGEDGRVVDGREYFLFLKSVDAAKELCTGKTLPNQPPSVDELTSRTWELFEAEANLDDGKWTPEDAWEKARRRHEEIKDGWKPNSRDETTSLVLGVEPYFNLEALTVDEGNKQLDEHLSRFFASILAADGNPKRMALRVTMGSGKTTRAIEHLKTLCSTNPNLNVEFYAPRHDLIQELLPKLNDIDPGVQIIHVRGRKDRDENGETPCQRFEYVKSLEDAGVSVGPNACWRSENEKCDHYNTCLYQSQFKPDPMRGGAVRFLPHSYLKLPRHQFTPKPDLIIIDEAFLSSIHEDLTLGSEQVRSLFAGTDNPKLGGLIVDFFKSGDPLLGRLSDHGVTVEWLRELDFSKDIEKLPFNARSNSAARSVSGTSAIQARFGNALRDILIEELSLTGRAYVSRIRFDPKENEVLLDRLTMPVIPDSAHILILDATADNQLLSHIFGNIEFHRVDFQQKAIVTQVYDRTGSNNSWNDRDDKVDDLIAVLKEHASIGDRVLCVSHQKLANRLRAEVEIDNLKFEHFGSLRGSDEYKDFQTIFITGRNQPPQSGVDALARAVWWNDEPPLVHDAAGLLGAETETNLPIELRGYLTTDPDNLAGVYVRSFSDPRIEILHQQIREAETIQAIARLRLVHSDRAKHIYLLGNLPIEMPIDYLVSWDELMPNEAEHKYLRAKNIPLTPKGWLKMRPDIATSEDKAKNLNKRSGLSDPSTLVRASPIFLRISSVVVTFREIRNGKPYGHAHKHLFRMEIEAESGEPVTGLGSSNVYKRFLEEGDPEIPNSGWGRIALNDFRFVETAADIELIAEPKEIIADTEEA